MEGKEPNLDNGKKIRIGLLGCGRVAPYHLHAISKIPKCELAAVCDIVEEKAKVIALKNNVRYYTRYEDMLLDRSIDLISVCTPHGLHAEHAIKAANSGKHVITEKPMAMNINDADLMIEACKRNNVRLFVIKQNRYNPPVIKAREALEKGRFGKLILLNTTVFWTRPQNYFDMDAWRGTKAMDGGVIMNQASHHIDLVQWFGGDVESVFAYGNTLTHSFEVEDTAVVSLKFKNGAMGVIQGTTSTFPKNLEGSLTILGEKGTVKIGGFAVNKLDHWDFEDFRSEDEWIKEMHSEPPNEYGFGHLELYKDVIGALFYGKKTMMTGEEGRKSLELIQAIYLSMQTGKEIKLPLKI